MPEGFKERPSSGDDMERVSFWEEVYLHENVLEEIENEFIRLVRELKEAIEQKTYDLWVSDDAGARLITRAFGEVVRQMVGRTPDTLFLTRSDPGEPNVNLEKFLQNGPHVRRALFVTEYVHTGRRLPPIPMLLDKNNIKFDLLVLRSNIPADGLAKLIGEASPDHKSHGHKIFMGSVADYWPEDGDWVVDPPPKDRAGTGVVRKGNKGEIVPVRKLSTSEREKVRISEIPEQVVQRKINKIREDIKTLATKAVKKVWDK